MASAPDGQDAVDDLAEWLLRDPSAALIDLDRELVARHGLRAFMQLAWPVIEGVDSRFIGNWHIDAIAEHLEAVSRGEIRRLMVAIPPRHMKSLSAAVTWPVWDWIAHPQRRFMFSSYSFALSVRDALKSRRILQSGWLRARWGHFKLISDQNTKTRYENDKTGMRLSTSVRSMATGEGGDVVCVDDPHLVREAESELRREGTLTWWDEQMSSRLNDPKRGAYVVIHQRVHERDLIGHLLTKASPIPWTYLCLPAEYEPDHPHRWFRDPRREIGELLWPEHQTREAIDALKTAFGPYAAAGQLQQRPAPRSGGIFKRDWFGRVRAVPPDTVFVRGWDLAGTSKQIIKSDPDWTVGAKVGWSPSLGKWLIVDVIRFREEWHTVQQRMLAVSAADGLDTMIQLPRDPAQAGKGQAADLLRLLSRFTAYADPVTGDKMARALKWAAKAGSGLVLLVDGPWNDDFLAEIAGFPTGAHDDQVDAVSSAFDRLLASDTGVMDWMLQQLRGRGVATGDLLSPRQRAAEANRAHPAAESAGGETPLDPETLAGLMRPR